MQTVLEILQAIGVFTMGVFTRFGLFLLMVAVLLLPALALALVLRGNARRRERALGLKVVDGVSFRPGVSYARGHLWLDARPGGGAFDLGLDGIAQRLVPAVSSVQFVRPGTRVQKGDAICALHGGGRALPIPAPFAGTVVGVNAAVLRDPTLVKREGFGRDWLVALAPAERGPGEESPRLESGGAAEGWMRGEAARWNRFVEERLGFAAADGGTLVAPAPWLVGEEGWRTLVTAFLTP